MSIEHDPSGPRSLGAAAPTAWLRWRAERTAALREPTGPLAITALHWLSVEARAIDGVPGRWRALDDQVWVDGLADRYRGAQVRRIDATVPDPVERVRVGEGSAVFLLSVGDGRRIQVIRRTGRYGIRVFDAAAPARAGFTGVPAFDYDPGWVITGRFTASPPASLIVAGAQDGLVHSVVGIGTFTFERDGLRSTLTVLGGTRAGLPFHDPTNHRLTGGWRTAPIELDQHAASGQATVDFNYATHLPSAFNDYGTCPLPPPDNLVRVPVTAGERRPVSVIAVAGPTSGQEAAR